MADDVAIAVHRRCERVGLPFAAESAAEPVAVVAVVARGEAQEDAIGVEHAEVENFRQRGFASGGHVDCAERDEVVGLVDLGEEVAEIQVVADKVEPCGQPGREVEGNAPPRGRSVTERDLLPPAGFVEFRSAVAIDDLRFLRADPQNGATGCLSDSASRLDLGKNLSHI